MGYDQLLIQYLRTNPRDFLTLLDALDAESASAIQKSLSDILESLPANTVATESLQLMQACEAIEEILGAQEITEIWLTQFQIKSFQGNQRGFEGLPGDRVSLVFYEYFCTHCGYRIDEEDIDVNLLGKQIICPHDGEKLILRPQKSQP